MNDRHPFEVLAYRRYIALRIASASLGDVPLTMGELCRRDANGVYVREDVCAAWWGWRAQAVLKIICDDQ